MKLWLDANHTRKIDLTFEDESGVELKHISFGEIKVHLQIPLKFLKLFSQAEELITQVIPRF